MSEKGNFTFPSFLTASGYGGYLKLHFSEILLGFIEEIQSCIAIHENMNGTKSL